MGWIPAALMIAALACVTLHGALLLFGKDATRGRRTVGILNLLLALSALTGYFLFTSGSLIVSPEYSVILAEGTGAWVWCLTTTLLIPFALWMALHSARVSQELETHVSVTLPLGAMCGIWTVIRSSQLNPGQHDAFTIYCVDLWGGPLVVWVVLCIVDWIFTTLRVRDRLVRICGVAFVLAYFALWANEKVRRGFLFADKYTLKFWWATAWVCIPLALILLTWIALRRSGAWLNRTVQIVVSVVAGVVGLSSAVLVTAVDESLEIGAIVWCVWGVLLLFALIPHVRSSLKNGTFAAWRKNWCCPDLLTLAALAVFCGCLVDLSHFIVVNPAWDLALLVTAWLVLQESSMGYPLRDFLRRRMQEVVAGAMAIGTRFRRQPHTAEAAAGEGATPRTTWRVFLTSIAIVVVLIAIPELFNAGKTIVEPFTSSDPGSEKSQDQKTSDIGKAVADRMVNTLGLLQQELRPDLLVSGLENGRTIPATMDETSASQAVVAGNNLQIPGTQVSIPFGFIATPIQRPLRAFLGVTMVEGTLQKDGSRYALLASSSNGETWRVDEESEADSCVAHAQPQPPSPPAPASTGKDAAAAAEPAEQAIVDQLAKGLAYRIATSDTRLTQRGMTSVWRAIPDFRYGLAEWQAFNRTASFRNLSLAIGCFRAAIDKDPNFALAYYRLGLAMEQDGQPGEAIDYLRRSTQVNPRFIAGHLALAQAVSYYSAYFYPSPPSLAGEVIAPSLPDESQYTQTAGLLRRVLTELREQASETDRAEAYVGLCRNELYFRNGAFMKDHVKEELDQGAPKLMEQYRQFFYCKRAEYLYSKLSSSARAETRVRPNEEWVVAADGYILAHSLDEEEGYQAATIPDKVWICDEPLIRSAYLKFAVRYYREAIALDPNDSEAVCFLAMAQASAGDTARLRELQHSAAARFARAAKLADNAESAYWQDIRDGRLCAHDDALKAKYDGVLREYEKAIELDQSNPDVLNNSAYQVYEWHLKAARHPQLLDYPSEEQYDDAMAEAARATRLTETVGSRIDHRVFQSTVGELDLAMGDPAAAAKVLNASLKVEGSDRSGIEHPRWDEIRWDLAQAYACMGPGSADDARHELSTISGEEEKREDQLFIGPPDEEFVNRNLDELQANCAIFKKAADLPKTEAACSQN
jgi:tetratricopeptide (TPR) repeat protein